MYSIPTCVRAMTLLQPDDKPVRFRTCFARSRVDLKNPRIIILREYIMEQTLNKRTDPTYRYPSCNLRCLTSVRDAATGASQCGICVPASRFILAWRRRSHDRLLDSANVHTLDDLAVGVAGSRGPRAYSTVCGSIYVRQNDVACSHRYAGRFSEDDVRHPPQAFCGRRALSNPVGRKSYRGTTSEQAGVGKTRDDEPFGVEGEGWQAVQLVAGTSII